MNLVRLFFVLAVLTGLALCVVWQGGVARQAGYRQEIVRREIEERVAEAQNYKAQNSKLESPQRIAHLVKVLGLDLRQAPVDPNIVASGTPQPKRGAAPDDKTEIADRTQSAPSSGDTQ